MSFLHRPLLLAVCLSLPLPSFAQVAAPLPRPERLGLPPAPQARPADLATRDPVARFYTLRDHAPFWTGPENAARLAAFAQALQSAWQQGLPVGRYDRAAVAAAGGDLSPADRARVDIAVTRTFLDYARDQRRGVVRPARIDPTIVRDIPSFDSLGELDAFAAAPGAYLRQIVPAAPEYRALVQARVALTAADWAPAVAEGATLRPSDTGARVMALAARLRSMGYDAGAGAGFDAALRAAVRAFQSDHGLQPDGVAGSATLAALNIPREERLKAVLVALERWRWMNGPLGRRHIWVNQTEQLARLVVDGRTTFTTRAVIGKPDAAYRTPEFSDRMEYMVVNPAWNVPRSITVAEYLPKLQRNPNAAPGLDIVDRDGNVVSRAAINFAAYDAATFPYRMRQPPSDDNALGAVKFMFPNNWNIYLHDTPAKSLFDQPVRAYSHGCVRLADPFGFAKALLALQNPDGDGIFDRALASGQEKVLTLKPPMPIHLVYFTAFPDEQGRMNWRDDIYGRDALIWSALEAGGVELVPVDG